MFDILSLNVPAPERGEAERPTQIGDEGITAGSAHSGSGKSASSGYFAFFPVQFHFPRLFKSCDKRSRRRNSLPG